MVKIFFLYFGVHFGQQNVMSMMLSLILRRTFFSLGKKIYLVELSRPFVSVIND